MRRFSASAMLFGCLALAVAVGCAPKSGDPGTGGNSGAAGTTGSAGTTGTAGTTGSAGNTGVAGTTGSAGASGTAGTGGSIATAGTTGTAGRGGTTGSAGSTAGTSGTAGTTGTGGSTSCTITATGAVSTKIATVGIVTFTTSLANPTSAKIEFGLTTSYGMTAPVDLTQPSYRTLLLGMKMMKTYHYRITATSSAGSCQGQDNTIMTGSLLNGLMKPTLAPATATGLYGGFLITAQYQGTPVTAFILDADGDYVWAYGGIGDQLTGARMDYAGTHMWINSANVPSGTVRVHRVTMDGLMDEDLSTQFKGLNHQLAVLPDETVAFYAYSTGMCDDIKERAPNGTVKTIVNSGTALKQTTSACHVNNIEYSQPDDTLVFSDLDHSQVAKVKRTDGSTVWILNGSTRTFTTGDTWVSGEHGLHLIDLTHILVFNNNSATPTSPSIAIEMQLDTAANKATKIWSYTASPAQSNSVMGDVQRLPNGNTIVAYSTRGVIDEVTSTGTLLQRITTAVAGSTIGYIEKRPTLYGPPPR